LRVLWLVELLRLTEPRSNRNLKTRHKNRVQKLQTSKTISHGHSAEKICNLVHIMFPGRIGEMKDEEWSETRLQEAVRLYSPGT